MNASALIGKIILWGFVIFAVCIIGYLFYVFYKVAQKKLKPFIEDDKQPAPIPQAHTSQSTIKNKITTNGKLRFCPECGIQVLQQNIFCPSCGGKLK